MTEQANELQLSDYLSLFRRQKTILVLVPLGIFALVALFTFTRDREYLSSSAVLVRTVDTDPLFPSAGDVDEDFHRVTSSELQFTSSRAYRQATRDAVDFPLDIDISIETEDSDRTTGDSGVLVFAATADSPERAQDAANAFAQNYIVTRLATDLAGFEARQAELETRVNDLAEELADLTAELDDIDAKILESNDPEVINALNNTRRRAEERIRAPQAILDSQLLDAVDELQNAADAVQLLGSPDITARVLRPAYLPENPISPDVPRNLLIGAIVAIIAGLGTAIVRDMLDDRVRDEPDLIGMTGSGVPVLAAIPRLRSSRRHPGGVLPYQDLNNSMTDAYRTLRNRLTVLRDEEQIRSIAFTSDSPGAGKTQTVVNFGETLANTGERVLLVGADLHTPALAERLEVDWSYGLCDVLGGIVDVDKALCPTGNPQITVLPSGNIPNDAADVLVGPAFGELLDGVENRFDTVLIDLPPTLGLSTAPPAAAAADAVLVVFDAQHSRQSKLSRAVAELEDARCNVLGLVANRSNLARSDYVGLY